MMRDRGIKRLTLLPRDCSAAGVRCSRQRP